MPASEISVSIFGSTNLHLLSKVRIYTHIRTCKKEQSLWRSSYPFSVCNVVLMTVGEDVKKTQDFCIFLIMILPLTCVCMGVCMYMSRYIHLYAHICHKLHH